MQGAAVRFGSHQVMRRALVLRVSAHVVESMQRKMVAHARVVGSENRGSCKRATCYTVAWVLGLRLGDPLSTPLGNILVVGGIFLCWALSALELFLEIRFGRGHSQLAAHEQHTIERSFQFVERLGGHVHFHKGKIKIIERFGVERNGFGDGAILLQTSVQRLPFSI